MDKILYLNGLIKYLHAHHHKDYQFIINEHYDSGHAYIKINDRITEETIIKIKIIYISTDIGKGYYLKMINYIDGHERIIAIENNE